MGVLDFDKCCCCIDLRSGCLIIGYLSLVGEIIVLFLVGQLMVLAAIAVTAMAQDKENHVDPASGVMLLIVSAIIIFILVFLLAFTIVLLVGIHQNKRGHVKAYLIYSIIFQVIFFIMFLVSLGTQLIVAGEVIRDLFIIFLNLYFVLVIRNYYRKMGETPRGAAIYNTA